MGLIYIRCGEPDEQAFALRKDGDPSDPIKHWESIQIKIPNGRRPGYEQFLRMAA